jgi:hypothetical protein
VGLEQQQLRHNSIGCCLAGYRHGDVRALGAMLPAAWFKSAWQLLHGYPAPPELSGSSYTTQPLTSTCAVLWRACSDSQQGFTAMPGTQTLDRCSAILMLKCANSMPFLQDMFT